MCNLGKLHITGGHINCKLTNLADVIEVAKPTGTPTALPPMQVPRIYHAKLQGVHASSFLEESTKRMKSRRHASFMTFEQTGESKTQMN